jgi:hypothetical protein
MLIQNRINICCRSVAIYELIFLSNTTSLCGNGSHRFIRMFVIDQSSKHHENLAFTALTVDVATVSLAKSVLINS